MVTTHTQQLPAGVNIFEFDWPTKILLRFPGLLKMVRLIKNVRFIFTLFAVLYFLVLWCFDVSRPLVSGFVWVLAPLFLLTLMMRTKTISRRSVLAIFSATVAMSPIVGFLSERLDQLGMQTKGGNSNVYWQIANPAIIAPVMEEVFKIWPLFLLPLIFSKRVSRFTGADWLIVTFASGAGFMAFEDSMRNISLWQQRNHPLTKVAELLMGNDGVQHGIAPWSGNVIYLDHSIASHAVLAAVIGGVFGITRRLQRFRWLTPLILTWAIIDHSVFNDSINNGKVEYLFRDFFATISGWLGNGSFYQVAFFLVIFVIYVVDIRHIGNPFRHDIGVCRAYMLSWRAGRIAYKSRSLSRQISIQQKPRSISILYVFLLPVVALWVGWLLWLSTWGDVSVPNNPFSSCLFCIINDFSAWWADAPWYIQALVVLGASAGLVSMLGIPFASALTAVGVVEFGLDVVKFANDDEKTFADYFGLALSGGFAIAPFGPKGPLNELIDQSTGRVSRTIASTLTDSFQERTSKKIASTLPTQHSSYDDALKFAKDSLGKFRQSVTNVGDDFAKKIDRIDDLEDVGEEFLGVDELDDVLEDAPEKLQKAWSDTKESFKEIPENTKEFVDETVESVRDLPHSAKTVATNATESLKSHWRGITKYDIVEAGVNREVEGQFVEQTTNGITYLTDEAFSPERFLDTRNFLQDNFEGVDNRGTNGIYIQDSGIESFSQPDISGPEN